LLVECRLRLELSDRIQGLSWRLHLEVVERRFPQVLGKAANESDGVWEQDRFSKIAEACDRSSSARSFAASVMKRRALYGRYHPTFSDFRAAIQEVQDGLSTKYVEGLVTLMTLNFQQFEDVSLVAA
jgi:hypothetical protein